MEWVGHLLDSIKQSKILVCGDVMLDQYWLGDVERISPEAPVPILSVSSEDERLGGAGNVAHNIVALGAKCSLLGIVGDDEPADRVFSLLKTAGINNLIQQDKAISTLRKLRIIASNQQLLRIDFEKRPDKTASEKVMEIFKQQISQHDAVVLSDYQKGSLLQVDAIIDYAKSLSKKVFVDPKGRDFSIYSGASLITPNLNEFELVAGKVKDNDDIVTKALQMMKDYHIDAMLVTLGERGMIFVVPNSDPIYVPAKTKEVYDVSGAGDTVIATIATLMCSKNDLSQASTQSLELANLMAGLVISKLGTSVPDLSELYQKLNEDS